MARKIKRPATKRRGLEGHENVAVMAPRIWMNELCYFSPTLALLNGHEKKLDNTIGISCLNLGARSFSQQFDLSVRRTVP